MIELFRIKYFICLAEWLRVSDWVKWLESPILGGMVNWSHAAFTRSTGNVMNSSLSFFSVMRFADTEVIEDTVISVYKR